jgi:hypothetical protein
MENKALKTIFIVVLGVAIIGVIIFALNSFMKVQLNNENPIDTQNPKQISINIIKATTQKISFTVNNNSSKEVSYYPESCASKMALLFKENDEQVSITNEVMCLMMPEVVTLKANFSVSGEMDISKFNLKSSSQKYYLLFKYGEPKDQFSIMNSVAIKSDLFTLSD